MQSPPSLFLTIIILLLRFLSLLSLSVWFLRNVNLDNAVLPPSSHGVCCLMFLSSQVCLSTSIASRNMSRPIESWVEWNFEVVSSLTHQTNRTVLRQISLSHIRPCREYRIQSWKKYRMVTHIFLWTDYLVCPWRSYFFALVTVLGWNLNVRFFFTKENCI